MRCFVDWGGLFFFFFSMFTSVPGGQAADETHEVLPNEIAPPPPEITLMFRVAFGALTSSE